MIVTTLSFFAPNFKPSRVKRPSANLLALALWGDCLTWLPLGADDWSSALLDPCFGRHSLGNHLRHWYEQRCDFLTMPAIASIPSCSLISGCERWSPSILGLATSSHTPTAWSLASNTYRPFFDSTDLIVPAGV